MIIFIMKALATIISFIAAGVMLHGIYLLMQDKYNYRKELKDEEESKL